MKVRLGSITKIQMGYSFRSRLERSGLGGIKVIQMKDLMDEGWVNCQDLIQVDMPKVKPHHLVECGDLIFRSRGSSATSAILTDNPGKAVLAAPLLRIRVSDRNVLPEYLNWFINQKPAQSFLARMSSGTAQKMIGMDALKNLEIEIPSLEKQSLIIELADLAVQEQALLDTLAEKRKIYLSETLLRTAEE